MCSAHGNLYAVMKEVLKRRGMDIGTVRKPLTGLAEEDFPIIEDVMAQIDDAIARFC